MDIRNALKSRKSVRKFQPREVETEKIGRLLEAATWAPNDRLREPWHFYVITGEAKRRYEELIQQVLEDNVQSTPAAIEQTMQVVRSTPLYIIVTSDVVSGDEAASKDNEYAVACAIYAMWLAASELGLGMVWRTRGIGLARDERLYRFIGAPENKTIIGTLCIGYPENEQAPTSRTVFTEKSTWL
ncbi:nitroreductase [Paenibacillus sp. P26]|nr:nitroreductase [Paenibacillus sp. P26]UUZ93942.1 nitroreductase [Paenibacillus sp. P25]